MKIEELRVGNLTERDGEEFIIKDVFDLHEYQRLNPVPLTEELLIRFGFEKHEDIKYKTGDENNPDGVVQSYWYSKKVNSYTNQDIVDEFTSINYNAKSHSVVLLWAENGELALKPMQYTHQLQNLYFALTSTELLLK